MKRLLLTVSLFLSACSSQESTYPLKPKLQDQEKIAQLADKDPVSAMQKSIHSKTQSRYFYEENKQIIERMRYRANSMNASHNLPKVSVKEYQKK